MAVWLLGAAGLSACGSGGGSSGDTADMGTGEPTGGTPAVGGQGGTGGNPIGGSGGTPVGGTPVGGTPVGGTPVGGEPVGGEPVGGGGSGGEPVGGTPVGGEPVGGTPVGGGGSGGEPVGGGGSGGEPAMGIEADASASGLNGTFNSAPSPDGLIIYYTAMTEDGGGVYSVPAAGGDATTIAETFILPMDVVASADGAWLYVVDTGVDAPDSDRGGAILKVASAGGVPELMAATAAYEPRGLDVVFDEAAAAEWLYFSGRDPATGNGGVFRVPTAGGDVEVIITSDEIVDPSGLAVAAGGDVYLADNVGAGDSGVFHVMADALTRLEVPYRLGYPAGLAMSPNGEALLISAQNPTTGNAAVVAFGIADGLAFEIPNENVNANPEAGGLHRALSAPVLSWCGSTLGAEGTVLSTVYRITLQ